MVQANKAMLLANSSQLFKTHIDSFHSHLRVAKRRGSQHRCGSLGQLKQPPQCSTAQLPEDKVWSSTGPTLQIAHGVDLQASTGEKEIFVSLSDPLFLLLSEVKSAEIVWVMNHESFLLDMDVVWVANSHTCPLNPINTNIFPSRLVWWHLRPRAAPGNSLNSWGPKSATHWAQPSGKTRLPGRSTREPPAMTHLLRNLPQCYNTSDRSYCSGSSWKIDQWFSEIFFQRRKFMFLVS